MAETTFNEYKSRIENLPKGKRLDAILSDIGCDFPIFYGTVSPKNPTETEKWYVTDVHQINSSNDLNYPYADAPWSSIKVFLTNKAGVKLYDKVFFSVGVGRLQYASELFVIKRIVRIDTVLENADYRAEDFDYENLVAITAAFIPTGIDAIDQISRRVDECRETLTGLTESMELASPSIDKISETFAKIKNPEELEQLAIQSSKISETLDRLQGEKLPTDEEFEKLDKKWNLLQQQANNTIDTINKVIHQLSTAQHEFIDAYPETKHLVVPADKRDLSISELDTIKKRLEYNYPEDKIKLFISALNTTQIIALCGKPGTGKTTFAEQMAKALGACFHLVEVQNNWTDRTDLLGFYNPTNQTYQSTNFLEALLTAKADLNQNQENAHLHIICLDEMNLSRVEYYFATFLSLLQRDEKKRFISLLPTDADPSVKEGKTEDQLAEQAKLMRYARFTLPRNVRFVGTMNMDDTAQFLSPKVIDRSLFLEFDGKEIPAKNETVDLSEDVYFPYSVFTANPANLDEISSCINELDKISHIAPRMQSYMQKMWPIFHELTPEETEKRFVDAMILTKILPATTRKFKDTSGNSIEVPEHFQMSSARYQDGITRGNAIHHYDSEIWSFWE